MEGPHVDSTYEELIDLIRQTYEEPDLALIEKAYSLAHKAHADKRRQTGHEYISHPVSCAYKLAEMKLSLEVVAAGLLHDVIEDTDVTLEEIEQEFGSEITEMVDSVTKLKKVKYQGNDYYAENMRRMFLAFSKDVRVVFIKFADRIHNLKTLYARPREKQVRVARETLEIYAPIANRLGMGMMRGDLEDLAFMYAMPKEYEQTATLLERTMKKKEMVVNKTIELASKDIQEAGVICDSIHGRIKRLYSFYKKLERYKQDISKIYDIVAIRIIVDDVVDCYAVLGILHNRWKPLAGRIKDYIAQPKPNGYQSLHTTVFAEDGAIVEFQIRTREMHENAEYGVSAHWRYKENGRHIKTRDLKWMEELIDVQKEVESKQDFLDQLQETKLEVFQDRIFIFTPKGDVIDLPSGSTPIDFAYAIHTDVGNQCVAARINDKMVNLDSVLFSGDMCEIVTDKNRKGPNPDWLKFAKTNHARSKIRETTKSNLKGWFKKVVGKKSN